VIVPLHRDGTGYAGVEVTGDSLPAAFPLGGIGTGNVSVDARGQLRDWALFNSPGKGNKLPYSFFAMHCASEGGTPVTRILEGPIPPPHESSHGYYSGDLAGLPRLMSATMRGSYPFVELRLRDDACPVEVTMESFTPLVPLDADASGIPAAVIRYRVTNTSDVAVDVNVAGSLANGVGINGYELFFFPNFEGNPRNEYRESSGARGLLYTTDLAEEHRRYGSMALLTSATDVTYKTEWLTGVWWDGAHDFWDEFSSSGRLTPVSPKGGEGGRLSSVSKLRVGSLAAHARISPAQSHTFEFVLAWHFPNRPRGWLGHEAQANDTHADENVRNHYATRFTDAWDAGTSLMRQLDALETATRRFHNDLVTSTLPAAVIDALLCGVVALRSTTCFRIEDGTFLSWEGTFDHEGSCEGNCTHVWNYAQTAAFLFPELEQSMRRTEFLLETDDAGAMAYRSYRVFGGERWDMLPAVDGQLGCVVRLYRDWRFSGDDTLLGQLWPSARRALDYADRTWDLDGDGVLDSEQHNTYDIEFHGPSSLTNSIYFAALLAGSRMGAALGDHRAASRYAELARSGAQRMDQLLWADDYYVQIVDDVDKYRYQYGTGCLADQVFGQYLAHVAGLGYVLPASHVRAAVNAVHANNLRPMAGHANVQRTFALNDERGVLLCTWPHGGRPRLPFVYCDEVWTGIEYEVAAHLLYEGEPAKAQEIVEAVRDRHDGVKRNPWNEVECGNHYVRSMASWALLLGWSGYRYDAPNAAVGFDPPGAEHFQCLFTSAAAWGTYQQQPGPQRWQAALAVHSGTLPLRRFTARPLASADWAAARITADDRPVSATARRNDDGTTTWEFGELVTLTRSLEVVVAP
jgi:non-lysosomal glucosylceramidase